MTPLTEAVEAFKGFLSGVSAASRVVILHDSDADGVTAGLVLQRALERAGYSPADQPPRRRRSKC